jgi:putative acetyltransferase
MADADIRPIRPGDNAAMARIIRDVMTEFGAVGPGYSINDAEVDAMWEAYQGPRAAYFVVEDDGRLVGGGGVAPLEGGDPEVCELRKMYFVPGLRGRGIGRRLLSLCLDAARERGFRQCYLETLAGMSAAQRLYEAGGFRRIPSPMGGTGHTSCNTFYVMDL